MCVVLLRLVLLYLILISVIEHHPGYLMSLIPEFTFRSFQHPCPQCNKVQSELAIKEAVNSC